MRAFTILFVTTLAATCFADDDLDWSAIDGVKTKYAVVSEGPEGNPMVEAKDTVTVHATGIVKQTNKKFWSTKDEGQQPFTYTAGIGGVITGWDQGCLGPSRFCGTLFQIERPALHSYGPDPHSC